MFWVKFKQKYINLFSIFFSVRTCCKTKLANFNNNQLKFPIEGHYSNHPEPILSSFHKFCRRFFQHPKWLLNGCNIGRFVPNGDCSHFFVINGISYISKTAGQSMISFPSLKLSILIKMQKFEVCFLRLIKIGATA